MVQYIVHRCEVAPPLSGDWASRAWGNATEMPIDRFHPRSSEHRPQTTAKLAYTRDALHLLFRVRDRYVKSVATQYGDRVCRDSCVEFFVEPKPGLGYFNFETNCGGTMLLWYITDPARDAEDEIHGKVVVPESLAKTIGIYHSMPPMTPIEIVEPIEWRLHLSIPFAIFEPFVGPVGDVAGQTWRGNLFKCGDRTSHAHWAAWADVGEALNFHQPAKFGRLVFE